MDYRLENRMEKHRRTRGRPRLFDEEPGPAPPPERPQPLIEGRPCPCGKPLSWLTVYKTLRTDAGVTRYCVCRGCGRRHTIQRAE
jgi:hypothetical protein